MKRFLLAMLFGVGLFSSGSIRTQAAPPYTRTEDVIYGRKFGMALTLDVFQPEKPNGAAIFYIVSVALAMTTPGNTSMTDKGEVEKLMKGGGARVQR